MNEQVSGVVGCWCRARVGKIVYLCVAVCLASVAVCLLVRSMFQGLSVLQLGSAAADLKVATEDVLTVEQLQNDS